MHIYHSASQHTSDWVMLLIIPRSTITLEYQFSLKMALCYLYLLGCQYTYTYSKIPIPRLSLKWECPTLLHQRRCIAHNSPLQISYCRTRPPVAWGIEFVNHRSACQVPASVRSWHSLPLIHLPLPPVEQLKMDILFDSLDGSETINFKNLAENHLLFPSSILNTICYSTPSTREPSNSYICGDTRLKSPYLKDDSLQRSKKPYVTPWA